MATENYLNSSLRKIVKGASIGFIGTFTGMALGYFTRMIIARFLGAGDYGLVSLGFAAMNIAVTLSLIGMKGGLRRYISFYRGKNDLCRIKGTILGAIRISFPLSLVFSLVFFFFADWVSIQVFHEAELIPVLRIFSVGIPFMVLADNFLSATIGFQDLRYRVYVNDLFQNIFKLVAIVLFILLGFGVMGAAWGWVLAIILMPFLAFYFLEKRVFSIFDKKVKAIPVDKELLSFSFPLIFAGIAGLITSWTDTLMLGYFTTTNEVGIYNAALPTAKLLKLFVGSFGAIFMPVATELYSRNSLNELENTYSAVTKWIFMLVLPAFLLMFLFSDWVLKTMFGAEFAVGAKALSILSFGFFIMCIVGPTAQILQAYGRTRVIMGSNFFSGGANILLNYFLIPIYGINGAAVATGSSLVMMNLIQLSVVYKVGGMQPFRSSYIKPLIASGTAVSTVYVIVKYVLGVSLLSLFSMLLVFLFIYFFLLLVLRSLDEEDLMVMRSVDQKLGTKSPAWIREIIKRFL